MSEAPIRRVRLSVPLEDELVCAWLDAQANVSLSIREVIKDNISRRGLGDYFSSTLPEGVEAPVTRNRLTVAAKPKAKAIPTPKKSTAKRTSAPAASTSHKATVKAEAKAKPKANAAPSLEMDASDDFDPLSVSLDSFKSQAGGGGGSGSSIDDLKSLMAQ